MAVIYTAGTPQGADSDTATEECTNH